MKRIYFDNAATTSIDKEVLEAMLPFLTEKFGNPSSTHYYGRQTRSAIEQVRSGIAKTLHVTPGEIFFTSGGTESTNTAIHGAITDLGCTRIITSPIEHHATLHTCEALQQAQKIKLEYVKILPNGHIDPDHLQSLLEEGDEKTLVSLMHANNEIGNILDMKAVGEMCKNAGAYFHCDTVQTVGHYPIDLSEVHVHFINASAHKFHGPKGVGFLYVNKEVKIHSFLQGGSQERSMRAGTENIYGIIGLGKALELAYAELEETRKHIQGLKMYMAEQLMKNFKEVEFNGDWKGKSLYTVLNISLPRNEKTDVLLIKLDLAGICASGGSACNSGANLGSHVMEALHPQSERIPLRFSFSKENTKEEVDTVVAKLKELL